MRALLAPTKGSSVTTAKSVADRSPLSTLIALKLALLKAILSSPLTKSSIEERLNEGEEEKE